MGADMYSRGPCPRGFGLRWRSITFSFQPDYRPIISNIPNARGLEERKVTGAENRGARTMFPNRVHHLQSITGVAVTTHQNDEPADPDSVPPRETADLLTNVRREHIISHSNYPYILSEFRHKFLTKSPDPLSKSLCHRPAFQLSTLEI